MATGTIRIRATNSAGFDDWTVNYTTVAAAAGDAGTIEWSASFGTATGTAGAAADTTAPVLQSAEVDGDQLVLTYDEALDETVTLFNGRFVVEVDTLRNFVTATAISGATVTLTLTTAVTNGQTVTVDYLLATNAARRIKDLAGNDAAAFSDEAVANNTAAAAASDGDAGVVEWSVSFGTAAGVTVPPDAVEFDGDAGVLEWSVAFGTASGVTVPPDAEAFDGDAAAIAWSAEFGTATGETAAPVTGAYQTINLLADWWGQLTTSQRGWAPPAAEQPTIISGLAFGGAADVELDAFGVYSSGIVRLSLDDADLTDAFEAGGGFRLTVGIQSWIFLLAGADSDVPYFWLPSNGPDVLAAYAAIPSATAATLEISDNPDVDFAEATDAFDGDAAVIEWSIAFGTATGTTAAPSDTTAPTLDSATVDGDTLVLTYDEALDETTLTPFGRFRVFVDTVRNNVTARVIAGTTVTLTLTTAVTAGQTVTITYLQPTNVAVRLRDLAGNDAASLTDEAVANNTDAAAASDGDAAAIEWSVSFGDATGITVPPGSMPFDGDAAAIEWSAEFGEATGTAGAAPLAEPPPAHVGWLAEFVGTTTLLWSGDTELTLDGKTWAPGHFITIRHAGNEIGTPARRTSATFSVTDPALRMAFLQDPGPVLVEVRFIYSADRGLTWAVAGGKHLGRLSSPVITNAAYTVEIETYRGDADRGRPVRWSHERQVKRGGEGDLAFEMASQLEAGIETKFPP